jgi:hypothetical protein
MTVFPSRLSIVKPARWTRAWRRPPWRQVRSGSVRGRCAICGTRVRRDDALGLVDTEIAHAECALVHWLESSGATIDELDHDESAGQHLSDAERLALITRISHVRTGR